MLGVPLPLFKEFQRSLDNGKENPSVQRQKLGVSVYSVESRLAWAVDLCTDYSNTARSLDDQNTIDFKNKCI